MKDVLYFVAQVLVVVMAIIVTYCMYTIIRLRLEHILKVRRLRKLTLRELEQRVYRYEPQYFRLVGEEKDPVIEFRKAIENKDISTLYKKWDDFKHSFLALDYPARPMLLEYYDEYDLEIKELYERKKATL